MKRRSFHMLIALAMLLPACQESRGPSWRTLDACLDQDPPDCRVVVRLEYDPAVVTVSGPQSPLVNSAKLTISAMLHQPRLSQPGSAEASVRLVYATGEEELRRWLTGGNAFPYTVDRTEGALRTLAESDRGNTGLSFVVPVQEQSSIFFICTKPYLAADGHVNDRTLCQMHAPVSEFAFVTYPVPMRSLQEWRDIHQAVMRGLSAGFNTTVIRRS